MQCIGILDLNGLDSCAVVDPIEDIMGLWSDNKPPDSVSSLLFSMGLRTRFNGHRHAILFVAEIEPGMEETVKALPNIKAAQLLLRNASKIGLSKSGKGDWEILKKLVPEYEGTYSGEVYELRTIENPA